MVPTKDTNSKNPTVEDEVDAERNNATSGADRKPVAWSELFAQHESSLASHLYTLDMVKFHVAAESEAFRTVSLMLERTRQLMEDFKVIQRDFAYAFVFSLQLPHTTTEKILLGTYTRNLPGKSSINGDHAKSENASTASSRGASEPLKSQDPSRKSTPSFFFDSKPTPVPKPEQTKKGKKRSWREDEEVESENVEDTAGSTQKRKRTNGFVPGQDEDVKAIMPVSMETEDISDEVARRLKIREERRKNRNKAPEKRKRESMNSNASRLSLEDTTRPKKKVKSGGGDAKEGGVGSKPEKDKRRKRHSSGPDSEDNRAKKVKNGDR
ncbi:hypothetical protein DTO271G3_3515 [Paecilomyces variotii]|nr:hypothetical protein DTO271G3_3515 [Paecilomyces variotii]